MVQHNAPTGYEYLCIRYVKTILLPMVADQDPEVRVRAVLAVARCRQKSLEEFRPWPSPRHCTAANPVGGRIQSCPLRGQPANPDARIRPTGARRLPQAPWSFSHQRTSPSGATDRLREAPLMAGLAPRSTYTGSTGRWRCGQQPALSAAASVPS